MEITFASILIRVTVMYLLALVLIRLLGKQSIGELSTIDFVVITILGDPFDSVIFSEVTLAEGVVAFSTVALLHLLVTFLTSRSNTLFRIIAAPPRLLVENGMVQGNALAIERQRPEILASELRINGEDLLQEVQEARLESNGKLSVLKMPSSRTAQKQDVELIE
jgi:uncharacterized membrane protein YcaP (DUF421 family)